MQTPEFKIEPGFAILRLTGEDGLPQYLFASNPKEIIVAEVIEDVIPALERIENLTSGTATAIGFVSYEAGPAFDPNIRCHAPKEGLPLLWFGIYDTTTRSNFLPNSLIHEQEKLDWQPRLTKDEFESNFDRIKEYIASGDVYQVNFTFPMTANFRDDAYSVFRKIAQASEPLHGAFIDTGDHAIASFSPESFLEIKQATVFSKPMKGSAKRGRWYEEDIEFAQALAQSEKDIAENLMILDMVRNDLGRISPPGGVVADPVFKIESHPTVHQMVSTVRAETSASLVNNLKATFPPASITGAPKIRATEIISELETSPRGVYTGCIGSIGPGRQASLNVAIRTIQVNRKQEKATYSIGSGIVWDSLGESEYEECLLKSNILQIETTPFNLLETIRWSPRSNFGEWVEPGYELLLPHLNRLKNSATYFGFRFDELEILTQLQELEQTFQVHPMKVRLQLSRRGKITIESTKIEDSVPKNLRVAVAFAPIDHNNPFLYHKTTRREIYENASKSRPGFDDVLLWNRDGELCEGTIANVAVLLENIWWTPPISSGLLPGTLRESLLKNGKIKERIIHLSELMNAESLALFNSVRGWQIAQLED